MKTISQLAEEAGIAGDELLPMGHHIGKVDFMKVLADRLEGKPNGKYIDVTAITPTPLGEGKSTTVMGLVQGLAKCGKNVTGAIDCVANAHNLAMVALTSRMQHEFNYDDAMLASKNLRRLDIDPRNVQMKWAIDFCAQSLREIVIGLGGKMDGFMMSSGFAITVNSEIMRLGIEPLVHFTCKDKNRNQIESEFYSLDRAGVRNLLVMSGDYPVTGFRGRPEPVFDLDPVHTLDLIDEMNRGLAYPGPKGIIRHQPSDFFAGAAVSAFKATEAEHMVQYFKLRKKLAAGARFVVTQLGYDARKFHEVLQFMRLNGLAVPLVGNIYVLTFGTARLMNQNRIPGCVVTDKLLADLDRERTAPDKGAKARLLRAARMYAIMKGMGFGGVHIGSHNLRYEEVEEIIAEGESLFPVWPELIPHFDDPQPGGFYLYQRDPRTGLNTETPTDREGRPLDAPVGFSYRNSRLFHRLLFEPGRNLFGVMRSVCRRVEGTRMEDLFHKLEHLTKVLIFDCRDCGDCALADVAYSCPMSRCPKSMRNGACGGSFNGWCEVHPGKRRCIYVDAYARLKHYGEESRLDVESVPPCNWDFFQTSSWINFYLGRDHTAQRLGIPEVKKKGENIC